MNEYKRLTKKYPYYESAFYEMDCTNCMFKLIPCKKDIHCFKASLQRLGELEDKIEQGRLIELPCKVGDTVYQVDSLYGVFERRVESIETLIWWKEQDVFGKWFFVTKAEAEAKLAELRGGE